MTPKEKTQQGRGLRLLIGLVWLQTTPQSVIGRWLTPVPWAQGFELNKKTGRQTAMNVSQISLSQQQCEGCQAQVHSGRQKLGIA